MRGKPQLQEVPPFSDGITPADAGKTINPQIRTTTDQDHPRGCGENSGIKRQL